jgi:phosphatidylinositol 4-kinase
MRHLVELPFEVFTPAAIAAGIDVWTWIISEKPEYEIGVMTEINSSWLATVRFERGMFSTSQKYFELLRRLRAQGTLTERLPLQL